jgi:endonuclease/exonuclease/phosphatase (EEP) superfamily protein YafD
MKWIGLYLSYALIFFGLLSIVFPALYVSELAISFLPYMVVIHMFLAWYRLSRVFFVRRSLYIWLIVIHILWFVYFVQPLGSFYGEDAPLVSDMHGVSVLYANVSKINYKYDKLIAMIQEYDPDVVMFVEFADHHGEALKPFLSELYPYINRTSWSRTFVWSMVFSKYPVDDLADDFVQGAWRYGYFRIDAPAQSYYVYLVHTSSPISPRNYRMRNIQLASVAEHIVTYDETRDGNLPVLLLGDFNVSPRSRHYDRFVWSIVWFENVTRRFPVLFSRWLEWVPLFWSHIDHVFTTAASDLVWLEQVVVPGSDHRGYYFVLQ